ncbi:hypothetical protein [Nonomuraea recticatena]|uniref:Uncharacterized protein n=1 Tax=Nonomuraea recticatena TaxID=46178 RepID=A0ABN3SBL4_9ACTN
MHRWLAPMLYRVHYNEPESAPPTDIQPFTFSSPAQGDAYDFSVTLQRTARAAGKRARVVLDDEMPEAETVLQRACEEVRPITRRFAITEAGAAEQAANTRLADLSGSMAGVYRWTVRAEVNVPDEVRQLNRDAYRKQHDIKSKAAAALLDIESTDRVRQKWQEFFATVEGSAGVMQAIQLTADPKKLPQVITDLIERREKGAQELLGTVDKIMESYRTVDMLDLVVRNDTVLRQTLKLLGLPVPPLEDETVLVNGM